VTSADPAALATNMERFEAIQDELWTIAEDVGRLLGRPRHVYRIARPDDRRAQCPDRRTCLRARAGDVILLLGGSLLTLGTVGCSAGFTRRRSLVTASVLVLALGAVLTLVIDLERPNDGFIRLSQQPLIDVVERIGAPSS
jgi:hypothetical protein